MTRLTLVACVTLCLASTLVLYAQDNEGPGGAEPFDMQRIQVQVAPGGPGGPMGEPRVIIRRGNDVEQMRPGLPSWANARQQEAHLLGVDVEKKTVTVEIQPLTGLVGVDEATVYLRGGELIGLTDLPEQAEILAVYAPAVGREARAVVQLPLDQPASALRAIVGKVNDDRIALKDCLIEDIDTKDLVVIVDGKKAEPADLEPEDAVIVVMTTPNRFERKALLAMKTRRDDTSLKSVKARVAEKPREVHPRLGQSIEVVSGRPREVVLAVNDDSKLLPKIPSPWKREKPEPMTIEELKEKLDAAKDNNPLVVFVEFDEPKDDETALLDVLTIRNFDEFRWGGRPPQQPRIRNRQKQPLGDRELKELERQRREEERGER